ncbi:hypothetical protein HDV04_002319 [Boothiomyces sp. JEL0838]|nr:hypothetical protein HDV04_002513 [Boothiomyces sp. JEL0838]KAJ3313158.1 hypothetical protein HDV04_002319 [Boothiomyces sp. JEL0838]
MSQPYDQQAQMSIPKSPDGKFAVSALGAASEDCGTCCTACCCPCVVYGKNQQALNNKDSSFGDCCLYYLAAQFEAVLEAGAKLKETAVMTAVSTVAAPHARLLKKELN